MDTLWKPILWSQFGAAIDMLENAVLACPDEVWNDRSRQPGFWYVAFHTLFFLDLYLSDSDAEFVPPPPFTRDELEDEELVLAQPYSKEQLHAYLEHGRRKCRETIDAMTEETARQRCGISWHDMTNAEMHLYNMRHVQHHAAQLNLILRQTTDAAPRWVRRATT